MSSNHSSTKRTSSSEEESLLATGEASNGASMDGYSVTALIQRPSWNRLDVGPFVVLYGSLIVWEQSNISMPAWLQIVALPLSLLLHVAVVVSQQWSVSLQAWVGYFSAPNNDGGSVPSRWTHALVRQEGGPAGLAPVHYTKSQVATIVFQHVVFRCTHQTTDVEMDSLWYSSSSLPQSYLPHTFHRLQHPIQLPLHWYLTWKGHATLPSVKQAHGVYGTNTTHIHIPPLLHLLQQQLLAPFFLFQLFCVALWSLDEYWYYALFTLLALLLFETTVAYNRVKNLERLRGTLQHAYRLHVYRHDQWVWLNTYELVPGDLVSLQSRQPYVPADVLLRHGTAVVDEALLTGESIPQRKTELEADSSSTQCLNLQDHHKHSILFGGTVLVNHDGTDSTTTTTIPTTPATTVPITTTTTIPTPPDQGVVGIVLKTGFDTAQGSLLRTMATNHATTDGIHTRDTVVFVGLLLLCALASAVQVWQQRHDETRNEFRLILHVIIIVTSVVPPELPMELSLAVTNSVADLMRSSQVYCTEPFRIPLAGQVTVCCFDKTGTLTSDQVMLKGVRQMEDFQSPVPWTTQRIMVACHGLSASANGAVWGDPLEQAVLRETDYRVQGSHAMVANNKNDKNSITPKVIHIRHRFAFSSQLKRMTVLVAEDDSKMVHVLTKGAPETIKQFLKDVPINYDKVYQQHMKMGQRVLAMAYRELMGAIPKDRGSLEKDMVFAGFLILECPLKPDSKHVIGELIKSGHECVMITGDGVLTAVEVAKQVGMMTREAPVYELQSRPRRQDDSVLSGFEFVPLSKDKDDDELQSIPLSNANMETLRAMKNQGEAFFCISGSVMSKVGLAALQHVSIQVDASDLGKDDKNTLLHPAVQSVLKELVLLLSVFARHAPRQKESVIAAYNLAGMYTLMAGDGTNDVGALKRCHVGISIISAPEIEAKQRVATETIAKEQKKERKARKEGTTKFKKKSRLLEESLRQLQEAQNELDHVELGDASVASPFTSRAMSIKCCKDILQQGRCTLVTMLTIYKILGVNCLVNALVLTKLHMHGVKQGDRQLTILGVAVAALFLFVTRGKPLPTLSPTRPPSSVLCPQALISIAGQFAVHLLFIVLATDVSLAFVDPYDPSIIPDASFNPNVLNSCAFLLTMIATVNTFVVNYRGEPFMQNLRKNKMLLRSTQVCYVVLFASALEVFPPLNDLLQLAPFPETQIDLDGTDDWAVAISEAGGVTRFVQELGFPVAMSIFMALDTILAFTVEKIVLKIFP